MAGGASINWLEGVAPCPSPNCDPRPPRTEVDLLVIHAISLPPEQFGGPWIEALFTNALDHSAHPYFAALRGVRVSAHVLICRDGGVRQFVPFHMRAWHAGKSCFQGRASCNDFSIGIELEGSDQQPFDERQYPALAEVTLAIMRAYPRITPTRIVGHADIAPGRKSDPGPFFDWARYRAMIVARSHG
ncbi:MAG TPA: 1,6-anhydro-N-acetylmuramyl-L-alanine amidase AmpD [Gammaproteobacteria bacterium]|nr:1,6-anhydro-N-acetylmuramyl-L-alanine amidase AmpD [Gammaproteobacteria bacterium]